MKVELVTATPALAAELAAVLRPEDLAECQAAGYSSAFEALEAGLANSDEAWGVRFDGELGAVLGVDRLDERTAFMWCLTGAVVERAKLSFWRASRTIVEACRRRHGQLVCLVDRRHARARAWLERLGFVLAADVAHPASGVLHWAMAIGGA